MLSRGKANEYDTANSGSYQKSCNKIQKRFGSKDHKCNVSIKDDIRINTVHEQQKHLKGLQKIINESIRFVAKKEL